MNANRGDRRVDIDGLRAVAILPVVLYHLRTPFFHGGFFGVDVFFVISGYLIAQIIRRETLHGEFSILKFYERRIRRIFPALFAMIAIVGVAGYFLMFPREFDTLGKSIAATVLFSSNLYFFYTNDYFQNAAQFQPLLHTWSLAVEEQFYLLFPILMIFMRRRSGPEITASLAAIAALSFAIDGWMLRDHVTAAFYLPIPRAWELLIGAILAVHGTPAKTSAAMRETAGIVGLLAIAYASVFLSASAELSYPAAVYACGGAALLIVAGSGAGSLASRALANPIFVYIGRISYSLYLWHWPLIVGFKLAFQDPVSGMDRLVLLAASLLLAAVSTEFVEKPFRQTKIMPLPNRWTIFRAAASAIAASLAVSSILIATEGFAARFPPEVNRMMAYVDREDPTAIRSGTCFLSTDSNDLRFFSRRDCLGLDPERKNILIIGDSVAANLRPGLVDSFPNINFLQATAAGCAPTLHNRRLGSVCGPLMEMMFYGYLPHAKLDGVILAGRWANGVDHNLHALEDTIDYVRQFQSQIFVVGPIVEYDMPLPRLLASSLMDGDSAMIDRLRDPDAFALEAPLRAASSKHHARYLSLIDALCPDGKCRTVDSKGAPLQFDYFHPTEGGALLIAEQWRSQGVFD
ncbi:MAG TPA: acyltransferase family protein [Roseiarcus sp.]